MNFNQSLDDIILDLILYEPCDVDGCNGRCHRAKQDQSKQAIQDLFIKLVEEQSVWKTASTNDKENIKIYDLIDRQALINSIKGEK